MRTWFILFSSSTPGPSAAATYGLYETGSGQFPGAGAGAGAGAPGTLGDEASNRRVSLVTMYSGVHTMLPSTMGR